MQKLKLHLSEEVMGQIQEYFRHNEESRFIHRLHGILLKLDNQENSCEFIAGLFGQSSHIISNWINKVNAAGSIDVLRETPRSGRRPLLNAEQENHLREVISKPPEVNGITANLWDGKSLSYYINQTYGVQIGVRQCQRLFGKLGFSLKRARPVVAKADEEKKCLSKKTSRKSVGRGL